MKRFRPQKTAHFYADTKRVIAAPRSRWTDAQAQMTEADAQRILDEATTRLGRFPVPHTRRYANWQIKRAGIDMAKLRQAMKFLRRDGE